MDTVFLVIEGNPLLQIALVGLCIWVMVGISQRNEVRIAKRNGTYNTETFKPTPVWKLVYQKMIHPTNGDYRTYQETPQAQESGVATNNAPGGEIPLDTVIPRHVWLMLINEQYNEAPHTLLVGSTGSGKTYLAQAIIASRKGKVCILDPKWKPGKWGGLQAVTLNDDLTYTDIEVACQNVLSELKRRQLALKGGVDSFEELTVLVEELPTVLEECPTAAILFKRLGQLGRELRIRVIGLSQSDRVKTLKIEGEGDTRANYLFIRLGDHATKVNPYASKLARPATIEWGNKNYPMDTAGIDDLVAIPIHNRQWQDSGTDTLVPGGQKDSEKAVSGTGSGTGTADTNGENTGSLVLGEQETVRISTLVLQGLSSNEIYKKLGGSRKNTLAKIARVRAMVDSVDSVDN